MFFVCLDINFNLYYILEKGVSRMERGGSGFVAKIYDRFRYYKIIKHEKHRLTTTNAIQGQFMHLKTSDEVDHLYPGIGTKRWTLCTNHRMTL